ncbi:M15 family metallopeptidase [Flavobacteriaceae bacterium]|jgi:LAS superfamily LD-carboxypeptidase LdcB|nr:M15 family metallopeptidase [Flavobacteriaceae bacterium]MDB2328151.1 M15 family metallopeptidase [Flavobacteriaceae bacterium]
MNRSYLLSLFLALISLYVFPQNNLNRSYSNDMLLGMSELTLYNDSIPLTLKAGKAFVKMQKAAKKDGILLQIVSGYRSYDRQKSIWNRKFKTNKANGLSPEENIQKIIEYSTLPGTSRHHWGTEIDLIDGSKKREGDVLVAEKFHGNGPYVRMKEWMDLNAAKYGFYLPYTQNPDRPGFYYEPWHYSYAPLSIPLLKSYVKMDLNKVLITDGLEGSTHLTSKFISTYFKENILGIAEILK